MLRALGRMARFAALGVAVAILAPAPAAAEELPLPGTVTHSYTRPGANRPAVISGVLTGTQDASPLIVARSYLSDHPDPLGAVPPTSLRLERVRWHSNGAAVKFQQTHGGLDVIGGTVAVRVDGAGRVRWMSSGVTNIPASFSTDPWITAGEAVTRMGGGEARLVILGDPAADLPVLAWEVTLPRDLMRVRALRGWVDAQTGVVLAIQDRARRADHEAKAYQWNPVVSPLEVVTLVDLPLEANVLTGSDIDAQSCIDLRSCREILVDGETGSYHYCEPQSMAVSDGNGSFLDIEPPQADINPVDGFAEVQLYYHASQAYAAFRGFAQDGGFTLGAQPLRALANFRLPASILGARCTGPDAPPTSGFAPFERGMFLPAGAGDGGEDWLIFGQGAEVDLAYDGDLVFHEFGHAVLAQVAPLADRLHDPFGVDPTPAALHEGYADYFAAAISGDPEIAEYAGAALGSPLPSGAIRSAENNFSCPANLSGEPHGDGEIWLGALWQVRQAWPAASQPLIDSAVFAAMDMLGPADGLAVAQAMTVAEIEVALGLVAGEAVSWSFGVRGLDGCHDRWVPLALGEAWPLLQMDAALDGDGAEPAPLQFVVTLPEDAKELRLDFTDSAVVPSLGVEAAPDVVMLVKPGPDAILWSWAGGAGQHDATLEGKVFVNAARPGWGVVEGQLRAGSYRVQLANRGGGRVTLEDARFSAAAAPADPDGGVGVTPPGPGPGGDGDPAIGCACRAGGAAGAGGGGAAGASGAGVAALAVVALLFVRRRRDRR